MPPPSCTGISLPTSSMIARIASLVLRLAGEGAVQVDQVQTPRAPLEPVPRHRGRVFGKYGRLVHIALFQAYAVTVFQVDGGNQQHGNRVLSGEG